MGTPFGRHYINDFFGDGDLRLKKSKKVKINLVVSNNCCIFVIEKETNKQTIS